MQNNTQLITVYIPTYNRVELLKRAVNSVLSQSYQNFELIIVDDCSSDETIKYLEKLSSNDKRIIFFQNVKNSGACVSRNKAISEAKGKYITGLDDDDEFASDRLEFFLKNFKENYSFVCSSLIVIDSKKSRRSSCRDLVFNEHDLLYDNVAGNQFFTYTRYLRDVGGFDEQLHSAQDLDVMVRLTRIFGAAKRFKNLTYKLYVDQGIPTISTSSKKIDGMKYFYKKHKPYMSKRQAFIMRLLIRRWEMKPKTNFLNTFLILVVNFTKTFNIIVNFICIKNVK
tara:strand:+ start:15 stop:863 length:849 start_codon:yes stop_codon:yes gene_type:complete